MKKPVLVTLAAGMGSRYGGLKQMDPVGGHGQSIIDYSIYDARRAGFEEVIFVIKHEIEEDFKRLVGSRIEKGIRASYAFQELSDLPAGFAVPEGRKKPWGTTHAVLAARELIDGPFAVINCDDYYGPQAFQVIYDYLAAHADEPEGYRYAMVGFELGKTMTDHGSVARGVCRESAGHFLEEVVEHTCIEKTATGARSTQDGGKTWLALPNETVVSMNLWGFQKSFVGEAWDQFSDFLTDTVPEDPTKKEFYLPLVVTRLLKEKRATVQVLRSSDKWYGVTYQADKPSVVKALADKTAQGLYPEDLWG